MLDLFLKFQKKCALPVVIVSLILAGIVARPAIKLLTSIATDLIHLLPRSYDSVKLNDEIGQKFKGQSNLFLVIYSQDKEANLKATLATKEYLESFAEVDRVVIEKPGYDFYDKYKFMLVGLDDLYRVKEQLRRQIHKKKLGGMYIDFEEEENVTADKKSFEESIKEYRARFSSTGIEDRYYANADQTVYLLSIFPKSPDQGLSYFKKFGEFIQQKVKELDLKKFSPQIAWGYAGAIQTRVDEYNSLMKDLGTAGLFSTLAIILVLYLFYRQFVPMIIVFIPVAVSTIYSFAFCSLFFKQMNIVTSFLFSIILGLGVDIGIHLMTRYVQDIRRGEPFDLVHKNVIRKTGRNCTIGVITTVSSFYILTINDFKGFSDFGWIAGNGLIIALMVYLILLPCLIIVANRFKILRIRPVPVKKGGFSTMQNIPFARTLLGILIVVNIAGLAANRGLSFEWDFNKLKMIIPEREKIREMVKDAQSGRVNSAAAFLVTNQVQADALRKAVEERKFKNGDDSSIDYIRSYWDLFPNDQDEKMAVLKEIDTMLDDKVMDRLTGEDLRLVKELKDDIRATARVTEADIPQVIRENFWGNIEERRDSSLVFVAPLPHLQLSDGKLAIKFHDEISGIEKFKKKYVAVSSGLIFAEVLKMLFRDTRVAITLSLLAQLIMIFLDFRDVKRTGFVLIGLGSGMCLMLALMAVFDLKLNFYNMIIIPVVLGMGEDNSIHVVQRFDEFKRQSIIAAIRTSGGASFLSSLTTMIGYGGLCLARHPGLNTMGLMAIIGMSSCLLGSLVLLPILLQLFLKPDPHFKEH